MNLFLIFHSTYQAVYIGLAVDSTIIAHVGIPKEQASSRLLVAVDRLLYDNGYTKDAIAYIVANQGPAPFTTLRTVLSTVNGIAFATGIPLIGVNALIAFAEPLDHASIVMLNACNKAVYYAIKRSDNGALETGCEPIEKFAAKIFAEFAGKPVHYFGNGVAPYREYLEKTMALTLDADFPEKDYATLEDIFRHGYKEYEKHEVHSTQYLEPVYLKKPVVFCP